MKRIILIAMIAFALSSCGSTHGTCAAYASVEVENNNN